MENIQKITRVGTFDVCVATYVALRMFIMQVMAGQLHFLANSNAGRDGLSAPLLWPDNCIKIGGHIALLFISYTVILISLQNKCFRLAVYSVMSNFGAFSAACTELRGFWVFDLIVYFCFVYSFSKVTSSSINTSHIKILSWHFSSYRVTTARSNTQCISRNKAR